LQPLLFTQASRYITPEVLADTNLFMMTRTSNTGGWCIERGKGRIAVLLPRHTNRAWSHPKYRELHWRAAHGALRRDIPQFEM